MRTYHDRSYGSITEPISKPILTKFQKRWNQIINYLIGKLLKLRY